MKDVILVMNTLRNEVETLWIRNSRPDLPRDLMSEKWISTFILNLVCKSHIEFQRGWEGAITMVICSFPFDFHPMVYWYPRRDNVLVSTTTEFARKFAPQMTSLFEILSYDWAPCRLNWPITVVSTSICQVQYVVVGLYHTSSLKMLILAVVLL